MTRSTGEARRAGGARRVVRACWAVAAATFLAGCASGGASGGASGSATRAPAAGAAESAVAREENTLRVVDLTEGAGQAAALRKCAYVHFTGWLSDGRKFESTRDTLPNGNLRPPVGFVVGARVVIPGWDKGVVGMKVGGERRLYVPYDQGYGKAGQPPAIPPRADLVFDLELMAVANPLSSSTGVNSSGTPTAPECPAWTAVRPR